MPEIEPPDPRAQPLLRVIVEAIKNGRIRSGEPKTFISYSEALELMGVPKRGRAGQQLQREGLSELNEWTMRHSELPQVAALIVNKDTHRPGDGFAESHGRPVGDPHWEAWWMAEANRAIHYDWSPFLPPFLNLREISKEDAGVLLREDEALARAAYSDIIVLDPPPAHIRQSPITVGEILGWLAEGQSEAEILRKHSELSGADIRASLAYAADREKETAQPSFTERWTGKFRLASPDPEDARLTYLLERYQRTGR